MNVTPRSCKILVATDREADGKIVTGVLSDDFDVVELSSRQELALTDFERVRPDVLVLAFRALAQGQEYCLGLLRTIMPAGRRPHRTVVLCSKEDLAAVFALCKKEYFDDYVPYWPQQHDGFRLQMAVLNSARRRAAEETQLAGDLAAHAENAKEIEAVVDRRLAEGLRHVDAAASSLATAEHGLAEQPDAHTLRRALKASRESLAPMSEWAAAFRGEVAPHIGGATSLASKLGARRQSILIIEDDAFAAKLIAKALDQEAADVTIAADADAAVAFLKMAQPAVILMDVGLPGTDGVALTVWLKSSPALKHIPVVMLTGDARRETIERSISAGAAGFIVKPFARAALLAKIDRFLH